MSAEEQQARAKACDEALATIQFQDEPVEFFAAAWKAGVEWAEDHGDCSLVKWFVDGTREAEQSYADKGLPLPPGFKGAAPVAEPEEHT